MAKNHVDSNYKLAKDRFLSKVCMTFLLSFSLSQPVAGCSFFLNQLMQRKEKFIDIGCLALYFDVSALQSRKQGEKGI